MTEEQKDFPTISIPVEITAETIGDIFSELSSEQVTEFVVTYDIDQQDWDVTFSLFNHFAQVLLTAEEGSEFLGGLEYYQKDASESSVLKNIRYLYETFISKTRSNKGDQVCEGFTFRSKETQFEYQVKRQVGVDDNENVLWECSSANGTFPLILSSEKIIEGLVSGKFF